MKEKGYKGFTQASVDTKHQEEVLKNIEQKLHDPRKLLLLEEVDYVVNKRRGFPYQRSRERFEYILLTKEYIAVLGNHLLHSIQQCLQHRSTAVILEVGAGTGRLTHFLKEFVLGHMIETQRERILFVACDPGRDHIEALFPVERLTAEQASNKYRPNILLACWPNYSLVDEEQDSTGQDRPHENFLEQHPDLEEIIMIADLPTCSLGGIETKELEDKLISWDNDNYEEVWPYDGEPQEFVGMKLNMLTEAVEVQRNYAGLKLLSNATISYTREEKL